MHVIEERPSKPTLAHSVRALTWAAEHVRHDFADAHKVYPTDFQALQVIDWSTQQDRSITAGALATALGLSSGAVTYLVERLSNASLVERKVDPQDRRKVLLVVSRSGRRMLNQYWNPLEERLEGALSSLDEQERSTVVDALWSMQQAMLEQAPA